MKVYDCFMYWDEDLILDLRFNILDKYVDKFVVVESNKTWQNNKKDLKFDINKFKNFKDKIIYIPVKNMPEGDNPWSRENFQRNCISLGLEEANPDDLIIISDADEIPNLENNKIKNIMSDKKYAVFKQLSFYYKLNMHNVTLPYWYGSRISYKKYLKSPQWLRDLKFKKRPFWRIDKIQLNNIIENGGWHFCNLKKPSELLYKYKNMAETNDPYFTKNKIDNKYLSVKQIEDSIKKGKNLVGKNEHFKKIEIDDRFPNYITGNLEKFNHWIL